MKSFNEYLLERNPEFHNEGILQDMGKWGRKNVALPAALAAGSMFGGTAQAANPFVAEKPAAVQDDPDWRQQHLDKVWANTKQSQKPQPTDYAKLLQPFAGKSIKDAMKDPNISPEAWKMGAKLYKGTNSVGFVPNPNKPGSWMVPNNGSMRVKSTTKISNDELEQDDQERTPVDAMGRPTGKTTYDYGGTQKRVSGTTIRQIIPQYHNR